MKVIITGGGGFLGNVLARELFRRRRLALAGVGTVAIDGLVLADLQFSAAAQQGFDDSVSFVAGDVSDPAVIRSLVPDEEFVVFHLAAMVSGDGEKDFDGCLRANLDGTRHLLEACRASGRRPRLVFASSLAVFGGKGMDPIASDRAKPLPQTTYGMTKLMGELFINDYSRKGFVDGRAARLPTVFIRPGKPNAAASSFASGLFREPLNGQPCELPIKREQFVPLLGYRRVINNLIAIAECDAAALGDDRAVTMPSSRHRVADMIATLERVAAARGRTLGAILDRPDPVVIKIVEGWPVETDGARGLAIGMKSDKSVEQVIEEYIADFL